MTWSGLRNSIRTRLLVTLLGLITLTVFLISLLGVINIMTSGRNAERVGNMTARVQAQEYLVNLTEVTAEKHDLQFQWVRHDTEAMKGQQTIIEQQETRIADLEARLDELVQKLGVFNAR